MRFIAGERVRIIAHPEAALLGRRGTVAAIADYRPLPIVVKVDGEAGAGDLFAPQELERIEEEAQDGGAAL